MATISDSAIRFSGWEKIYADIDLERPILTGAYAIYNAASEDQRLAYLEKANVLRKNTMAAIGRFFKTEGSSVELVETNWLARNPIAKRHFDAISDGDVKSFFRVYAAKTARIGLDDKSVTEARGRLPDDAFSKGCVVVPVRNDNSHNYKLGMPVLWKRTTHFYRYPGEKELEGNNMTQTVDALRLPNERELIAMAVLHADEIGTY
jgi:hypothetical protein